MTVQLGEVFPVFPSIPDQVQSLHVSAACLLRDSPNDEPRIPPKCSPPSASVKFSRRTLQALSAAALCYVTRYVQLPITFFFTSETHLQGRTDTPLESSKQQICNFLSVLM